MMAYNLTVKGYVNGDLKESPAVTLTIRSIISMVELEAILTPIRESFNSMGDGLAFDVTFQDLDL
jgi:hypothetical protein